MSNNASSKLNGFKHELPRLDAMSANEKKTLLRFLVRILVLLLSLSPSLFAREVVNDQKRIFIEDQIRLARGFVKRGFVDEAIQEYNRLIRRFPNDKFALEAWTGLAEALVEKNDFKGAIATFEECLKRFPNLRTTPAVKYKYAVVLGKLNTHGARGKAIAILEAISAAKETPGLVRLAARLQLAAMLAEKGETAKSEKILLRLASAKPTGKPEDYYIGAAACKLADILRKRKAASEALRILERLASANFADKATAPRIYWMTGSMQLRAGRYKDAARTYSKLATLFPGYHVLDVEYNRLSALFKAGRYSKVVEDIKKLRETGILKDESDRFDCLLASSLMALKFHSASISLWRKVMAATRDVIYFRYAATNLIRALAAAGNASEAKTEATKLLDDARLDPESAADIARVSAAAAKPPEAVEILEKAVSKLKKRPRLANQLKLRLAEALNDAGRRSEALAVLAEIVDSPAGRNEVPYALLSTADVLIGAGRVADAEKTLKRLVREYPDSDLRPMALSRLAILLLPDKKRWKEVESLIDETLEKHPNTKYAADCLFYKAYILCYNGKLDESLKVLGELGKHDPPADGQTAVNAATYEIWALLRKNERKAALDVFARFAERKRLLETAPLSFLCDLGAALPPTEIETAKFCFGKVVSKTESPILKQKACLGLADALIASGDSVKGMELLRKAVALDAAPLPTSSARLKLGRMLVERGAYDKAVLVLEKCLENAADRKISAAARLELAKALAENPKRLPTARRYAMAVYMLAADKTLCVEAMLLSIELSLKLGKRKDALEIWSEFEKRFPKEAESQKARKLRASIRNLE